MAAENPDDDAEMATASMGSRAVAAVVDILTLQIVGTVAGVVTLGIVILMGNVESPEAQYRWELLRLMTFAIGAMYVLYITYFFLMHGYWGQTLGKKAAGIMVVNLDGSKISRGAALARTVSSSGFFIVAYFPVLFIEFKTLLFQVFGAVILALALLGLADVVFTLADSARRRSLHDRLAGTRVVAKP